jgi:hypothetical protein
MDGKLRAHDELEGSNPSTVARFAAIMAANSSVRPGKVRTLATLPGKRGHTVSVVSANHENTAAKETGGVEAAPAHAHRRRPVPRV